MSNFFKTVVGIAIVCEFIGGASLGHASLSRSSDSIIVLTDDQGTAERLKVSKVVSMPQTPSSLWFSGPNIGLQVNFPNPDAAAEFKAKLNKTRSYSLALKLSDDTSEFPKNIEIRGRWGGGSRPFKLLKVDRDTIMVMRIGEQTFCQKVLAAVGL